ncbi:hypothetical protein M747DRAFT_294046, partial [Aspergillus niger ATCC 13496]
MMTAMMLMATDNRQATTNERAEHSEERAVCWDCSISLQEFNLLIEGRECVQPPT